MSWWKFWQRRDQKSVGPVRTERPEFRFEVHPESGHVAVFVNWPEYADPQKKAQAIQMVANMLSIMGMGGLHDIVARTLMGTGQFLGDSEFAQGVVARVQENMAGVVGRTEKTARKKGPLVKPTDVFGINNEQPRNS